MEETQRNIRSGYRLDSKRSSAALSKVTKAENLPKQTSARNGRKFYFSRNREDGQMWRSDPLKPRASHILPYSRSTKEEWQIPIGHRYEISKFSSKGTKVQDGGARNVIKDARARRLYVHGGSSRWLSSHQHARIGDSLPRVSMGGSLLRLQGASLWSRGFPSRILEDNALNRISSETTGTQNTSIFRRFYRPIKKQIADVKKKISGITERSRTTHLKGKVKFRAGTRERISWSNGQDSRQTYVLRTEQEEDRGHQRDIKAIKEKLRAPPSSPSGKSSWSMYLPVSCGGTNKIADEESVQRPTEEAQLERENSVIRGSHSRSNMVERCNGILGWENRSTIESRRNYIHRRQQLGLGRGDGSQIGERILDPSDDGGINQFSRTNGNIHVTPGVQGGPSKQSYSSEDGQHIGCGVHQQNDGIFGSTLSIGQSNSESSKGAELRADGPIYTRGGEHRSGSVIKMGGQKRLDATPKILRFIREKVGPSFDRSDGVIHEPPSAEVQLVPLGSQRRGYKFLHSKLVKGKQLRKSSLQSARKSSFQNQRRLRNMHRNSSSVASTAMVQHSSEDERGSTDDDSQSIRHFSPRIVGKRGTTKQPKMGSSGIQSIWRQSTENWSSRAQEILAQGLKPSTLKHYDAFWSRFLKYCELNNLNSLPATEKTVVDFLADITVGLKRPYGTVNQACAAIRQAHLAAKESDPTDSHLIRIFKSGVSNKLTLVAQKKATPVDPTALCNLFLAWDDNESLSFEAMRMKSLALCSFVGMFRPSDAALLEKDKIYFNSDLSYMDMCLLGFKTDGQANGEVFRIWKSSTAKLCPVRALHCYIEQYCNSSEEVRVYPISSQRISNILKMVIKEAGMDSSVITARSFRSGGATSGIKNGVMPDQLMKIGRWKSTDVFYNHYVAARTSQDTTDRILGTLDSSDDVWSSADKSRAHIPHDRSDPRIFVSNDNNNSVLDTSRFSNSLQNYSITSSEAASSSDSASEEDISDGILIEDEENPEKKKSIEYYSLSSGSTTPEASSSSDSDYYP
jgi:hypothetical protein